jgi:glycyl-tRNA synthetase
VARKDWNTILPAYARCVRITRDQKARFEVKPAEFVEGAEGDLFAALQKAESSAHRPGSVDDFLTSFLPMIPAVNAFFDRVLVMAEEPKLRENRLGLLQRVVRLAEGAADLSRLEGF